MKLDKFKILRDNWKIIREEVLSNGFKDFQRHPLTDTNIYEQIQEGENPALALCTGGDIIEKNIKLYPILWKLYNELDIENKITIGFACLSPGTELYEHCDDEEVYRYHLCLITEKDTCNIPGVNMRNTESNDWINEGEDLILLPHKEKHYGFNKSKDSIRVHLFIDVLIDGSEEGLKTYRQYFNKKGWHDGTEKKFNSKWWV